MADTKAKAKKGLGKGLGAFFDNVEPVSTDKPEAGVPEKTPDGQSILRLKLRDIEPNPDQPRKVFDNEKLQALAESIAEHGLIQPILVKKAAGGMYVIIAGERRWRASKLAGLKEVPCILGDYSEQSVMELALIENLQREDLNPIEEAEGYQKLMESFRLTQDEVAKRVGKSRSAVANSLRLNSLSKEIKKLVSDGKLTQGHARAILPIEDENDRMEMAQRIIKEDLNVRQVENMVSALLGEKRKKPEKKSTDKNLENYFKNLADDLSSKLETKVSIKYGKKRGKIEIEYYNTDDLENILRKFK